MNTGGWPKPASIAVPGGRHVGAVVSQTTAGAPWYVLKIICTPGGQRLFEKRLQRL